MRVLFLPRYGRRGASSRLRFHQYTPYLEAHGFQCDVSPLFSDDYLAKRAQNKGRTGVIAAFARRLRVMLTDANRYDLVFMHCEALPMLPAFLEKRLARRGVRYVVDYDDAIFHKYDLHKRAVVRRVLGEKIADALKGARAVIAGNEYLADYARRVNENVYILPTVIDLERYPVPSANNDRGDDKPLAVGWIGSFSTAPYVREIEPVLRDLSARGTARFVTIGAGDASFDIPHWERREWREDTEVADLLTMEAGVMPLPDSPWARGKCGYKLIQYMACGLPVVASPVGVNTDIVTHGENGFLAQTEAEWTGALDALAGDREAARRMGRAGRARVETHYSLQVTAPRLAEILREAAGRTIPQH